MTRDEAVRTVAEALRDATFRWDDPEVEQKAAEVAVDALAIALPAPLNGSGDG